MTAVFFYMHVSIRFMIAAVLGTMYVFRGQMSLRSISVTTTSRYSSWLELVELVKAVGNVTGFFAIREDAIGTKLHDLFWRKVKAAQSKSETWSNQPLTGLVLILTSLRKHHSSPWRCIDPHNSVPDLLRPICDPWRTGESQFLPLRAWIHPN